MGNAFWQVTYIGSSALSIYLIKVSKSISKVWLQHFYFHVLVFFHLLYPIYTASIVLSLVLCAHVLVSLSSSTCYIHLVSFQWERERERKKEREVLSLETWFSWNFVCLLINIFFSSALMQCHYWPNVRLIEHQRSPQYNIQLEQSWILGMSSLFFLSFFLFAINQGFCRP